MLASWPVRVEMIAVVGALKVRVAARVSNSGSAGSIEGEWKAWLTRSGVVL
ncbi:hypothetical protein MSIMFB_05677 [Mycobacterium simulans]|uniref:Uncharacterized protein n=1 Tax=Mycobacterium simulans TaxID=627089 RepID=A0A7Z7ITE6_9MYCO|nr:hypothetical protein MSIMFB_05677 [Mycobacterium simulans]